MGIYPILSKYYSMWQNPEIVEEKSPGSCCIIEDRDTKSRAEWYLRMRDGTLHNKFKPEELVKYWSNNLEYIR